MDIRLLLVLLLPALATAASYSPYPMTYGGPSYGEHLGFEDYHDSGGKGEGGDVDISGSVSADVLNEGSAYAQAAAEEYGMKAKTVEQRAKWFRNLLNEKQTVIRQVKKRAELMRALASESLHNAEQYRRSAAEKIQNAKALETKAREMESLSKEQSILAGDLRSKMNSEIKQYLESLIKKNVAETNVETNLAEAERQKAFMAFLEKHAEEYMSEAAKWERISAESLEKSKKLKTDSSAESAKAKEFEKKSKEAEDAANESRKKAIEFMYFRMEFYLKALAEELQAALAKIKTKYHQSILASMAESASSVDMFARSEYKDALLWEKKTASIRAEAKLLEESAEKMFQSSEKLKASLKNEQSKPKEKKDDLVIHEASAVKPEPVHQPKNDEKLVDVPKAAVSEKKV